MEFPEIAERGFWQDPTDGAFLEAHYQELQRQFEDAVLQDDQNMWDISDRMRLVGKFFPLDDDRNPDNPRYHTDRQ